MIKVNLPRLLDANMHEVRRIYPLDGSLFLSAVPLSTATLTLKSEEMISVRDYVELFNAYGSVGIFRVRSQGNVYGAESSTVELEHAICEVGESICKTTLNKNAPLNSAINEIFAFYNGSKWAIGSNTFTDNVVVDVSTENVLEAILSLMEQVPEYMLKFNFNTTPWQINIVEKDTIVSAEGRLSRNIQNASVTYDDSEMCTRAFVDYESSGGKTTTVTYDSDTIGEYGVIEKHLPSSGYTQEQAQIVAQVYLKYHKKPKVAISVSGYDFSDITGETLDRLDVGKLYRLALPKYGVTVEENITGLNWGHLYSNPNDVEISIGNVEDPVVSFVRQVQKSSGGASKAVVKQHKEYWTKFDQTDYYLDLTAARVDENENILQQAGMYIDATGTIQYADDNENQLYSRIKVTAGEIKSSVDNELSGLHSAIVQTAEGIRSEVSAENSEIYTYVDQTASGIHTELVNAKSGLRAYVDQTAEYFRQTYISETSRIWIQDTDPRLGGISPKVGDVWVESTHQGTWDGAEGFDWEHDEDYDWSQVQGAKIWGWQNDKWELVSDQQEVVTMTDVEQTSEHIIQRAIKAMTTDDGNLSVYRAELEVMGDRIRSEVDERISGIGTTITQTAEQIRSEAHASQSTIYSEIVQTASDIRMTVAHKPIVFIQWEQPVSTEEHTLVEGDLWIKTIQKRYWEHLTDLNWSELNNNFNWSAMKGATVYAYKDGAWVIAMDETVLASDVDVEETGEHWQTTAEKIKVLEGKAVAFDAKLRVEGDKIRSEVNDKTNKLGSSITQTAYQIRSEVHAESSTLYSEIVQTASSIILGVNNTKSDLYSKIAVTQTSITTSVAAAKSTLYSEIKSTASSISLSVRNTKSDLYSKIEVTSTKIDTSVAEAQSTMYSQITQTSKQIRQEVANTVSGLRSSITQNANRIAMVVDANGVKPAAIVAAVNNGQSELNLSADVIEIDSGTHTKLSGVITINTSGSTHAVNMKSNLVTMGKSLANMITFENGNVTANGFYYKVSGGTEGALKKAQVSGNTLKIWKFGDADGSPSITFSKAVTNFNYSWSLGQLTVTAQPQGNSKAITGVKAVGSWSGNTYNGRIVYWDGTDDDGATYNTGATFTLTAQGGGGVPNRIEIWKSDDSGQVTGGNWPKSGNFSFYPWVQIDGSASYSGNVVTMTNPFTSKGNGWYCTIENLTTGGKRCRLTKEFSAGASVPFNNGTSYTLYT